MAIKESVVRPEDFVGLSKKKSQDLAEARNLLWRPIEVDGEPYFALPEDTRADRVCVWVVQNKVVKATVQ